MDKLIIYLGKKVQQSGGPNIFLKRLIKYSPRSFTYKKSDKDEKDDLSKKLFFLFPKTYNLSFYYFLITKKYPVILRLDGSSILNPGTYNLKNIFIALISDLITIIYISISNHIIFQSRYTRNIWRLPILFFRKNYSIIYNPSPRELNQYKFDDKKEKITSKMIKIICLEGSVQRKLSYRFLGNIKSKYKVEVYGKVSKYLRKKFYLKKNIYFYGYVRQDDIFKKISENPYIYICLEMNPPCPNSVLEMLSLGVPVVGLNTGSLKELIGKSGKLITLNQFHSKDFSNILFNYLQEIANNYNHFQSLSIKQSMIFQEKRTLKVYVDLFKKIAC